MNKIDRRKFGAALGAGALVGLGCDREGGRRREVVVYTALDEMYSRPILDEFGQRTGIEARAVYDTEAAKTTGLVTRLLAEKSRPRADVFWNNEVAQTILLKDAGVLAPYQAAGWHAIPQRYRDADAYWTGLAARARVIIYNTELVSSPPTSILDLLKPEWAGKAAIAKPLFGTTATHAAALFAEWGQQRAREFFLGLKANQIATLAGNATVRDQVARGECHWGLTDTDDANGAIEDGLPARWLLPDQEEGGLGTLLIPNSVALVAGGPFPEAGQALVDYLLSPRVEGQLALTRSIQIPLNPLVKAPARVPKIGEIKTMAVDFAAVAKEMATTAQFMQREFLR